jgi:hypothetical protein
MPATTGGGNVWRHVFTAGTSPGTARKRIALKAGNLTKAESQPTRTSENGSAATFQTFNKLRSSGRSVNESWSSFFASWRELSRQSASEGLSFPSNSGVSRSSLVLYPPTRCAAVGRAQRYSHGPHGKRDLPRESHPPQHRYRGEPFTREGGVNTPPSRITRYCRAALPCHRRITLTQPRQLCVVLACLGRSSLRS